MSANTRWSRVLRAVEAEAQRAEALLESHDGDGSSARSQLGPEIEPPPLDELPPLPDELASDVQLLQLRIAALQDELGQALREWRPAPEISLAKAPARPVYVDRRL